MIYKSAKRVRATNVINQASLNYLAYLSCSIELI